MNQRIRIKLKSYDHVLVDNSAEKIVKSVKATVLRSPHVNSNSKEQFQLCTYKRLMDIYSSSSKTVDALMKLELPSGVDVEIKI